MVSVAGRVLLGGQEHFYLEPHSALAVPAGDGRGLTVFLSTQVVSYYVG